MTIVKGQSSLKLITGTEAILLKLSREKSYDTSDSDDFDQRLSMGSNLDDSIEMKMMQLTIDPTKRSDFEKERDITQYLKNSGVKTKTDPRTK